jgi:hypothetical protein
MAKSPEQMRQEMIDRLAEKTGRSFRDWQALIRAGNFAKHGEIIRFLKGMHGVSHGYANQIALEYLRQAEGPAPGGDDLIAAQYSGKKAPLRALYEKLAGVLTRFGNDVELSPKKAYVSVRRAKQFAILQPTTATRLDVGIQLPGQAATKRLEKSGSFHAMVSHRVRISSAGDIDGQLERWLRSAYDAAG